MQHEVRFATFNLLNLALPGIRFYPDQEPYTQARYDAKVEWIAQQIDRLDADVIGFQEVFSQAALKDVLARTKHYQQAHLVGFDPIESSDTNAQPSTPNASPLTPSVALVSRLPLTGPISNHTRLPHGLAVALPGTSVPITTFTRPILHVQIVADGSSTTVPGRLAARTQVIDVFVCHLKSKRPDFSSGIAIADSDSYQTGMAMLHSMIRRGAEALGLRYLISDQLRRQRLPLVVLGDFNDTAAAMTTQLVSGAVSERRSSREGPTDRLFDSFRVQSRRRSMRGVGFSHIHDGAMETIDHVLVSDAFEPGSPTAIGEVLEVIYLNDHLSLRLPEATDHGIVLARVMLFGSASNN
ncbi:MAG: endonuclease/exonuclease/phosphatase family protein [Pseudomonadota bacterium]